MPAPSKSKYTSPPPTQTDLNAFVGAKPVARQKTLGAMFKKAAGKDDVAGPLPDEVEAVVVDEDQEMEDVKPAGASKKRRTIAVSSDEDEEEGKPKASSSSPKKLKASAAKEEEQLGGPSPVAPVAAVAAVLKSPAKVKATPSPTKSSKKASPVKPAASSFFAPKPKIVAEGNKGKSKADSEDPEEKDEEEEEEEESESEEEDDEDAGKLAEIFTAKPKASATKVNWKDGEPVPYSALTGTFLLISATTKRLEISALLSTFLAEVIAKTPGDLLKTVYLCINRLCPDYEPNGELGIGESLLMKAIGESTGRTTAQIKTEYKKVGDLGEVAQSSRNKQKTLFKPKPLTVKSVFDALQQIARTSGNSSQAKKVGLINKLLAACVDSETKFLIRSLEGKLRIGLAEKTVLVGLAHAVVTAAARESGKKISKEKMTSDLEEGSNIVKAVFSELPSYDIVIPALLKDGVHGLKAVCFLTPGVPLKPMLAKPTKAITEVLDRFEGKKFTCEYKYDGERAQVHYLKGGAIKVFSRNSEDMSVKYPDIVEQLPKCIREGVESFVIDAEAVAWSSDEKRLLPFQELSRRKRKDVKAEDITVKVHLFAFDMLYLNGVPLLGENLEHRRQLMRDSLQPVEGEFAFATSEDATDVEDIQVFLDRSVKEGCEGLMVKLLEGEGSSYEPSRRSIHWLKLKKDYLAGVGDSFDLVVIGGDYGKGKRTNVYGAFHLACYDVDTDTYQSICKIGTGFSEEILQSHYDFLHPLELAAKKPYYDVGTGKGPDVYFEPKMVWEVLAADLSLSPIYTAAKGLCGDGSRGISLRFPRFLRIRDDKDVNEATGPTQIAEAYERQATVGAGAKGKNKKGGDADDGFW